MKIGEKAPTKSPTIEKLVTNFCLFIKDHCPDASISVTKDIFDDEDADIDVYPPSSWTDEQSYALHDQLAAKSVEILCETGYLILAGVFEPGPH
jgi:hypothetical protein